MKLLLLLLASALAASALTVLATIVVFARATPEDASGAHASSPTIADVQPDGGALGELRARLDGFAERTEALERDLNAVRALSQRIPADSGPDTPVATQVGRSENADAGRGLAANWISVLDQDIGRVLVERGLTPYDPGVAIHVRTAGDALRKARSENEAAVGPYRDSLNRHEMTTDEYLRITSSITQASKDKRLAALAALERSLDELAR